MYMLPCLCHDGAYWYFLCLFRLSQRAYLVACTLPLSNKNTFCNYSTDIKPAAGENVTTVNVCRGVCILENSKPGNFEFGNHMMMCVFTDRQQSVYCSVL